MPRVLSLGHRLRILPLTTKTMKLHIPSLTFLLLLALFAASCTSPEFNKEMPYAILMGKFRSVHDAHASSERLQDMGVANYLKAYDDPREGRWYLVLSGSFGSLESCMADRILMEDRFQFYFLDIANYNQLSEYLSEDLPKVKSPAAAPQMPALAGTGMQRLIRQLHASRSYSPQYIKLVAMGDSLPLYRFDGFSREFFDLPRGIDPRRLIPRTKVFAEVGYKDELVGTEFVVHAFEWAERDSTEAGEAFTDLYAREILDTREYSFEEQLPLTLQAESAWQGYTINLEPKRGKLYRYMVLRSADHSTGVFIQSLKCTSEQMEAFAKGLGQDQGLFAYHVFKQNLQRYPGQVSQKGVPYFISMRKLADVKGRLASKLEANWKTEFDFYHSLKGNYTLSFTSLPDSETSESAFSKVFAERSRKDSVVVNGRHAWLITKKRRHPDDGKTFEAAREIQFMGEGTLGIFKGGGNCLYRPEEALRITESTFQGDGVMNEQGTGVSANAAF